MRSLVLAAVVLVACGDDGTVDPSEATASDLVGIWTSDVTPGVNATGISFHPKALYHPMLENARDVYAMYNTTPSSQFLEEVGTYRVEGGVLYRSPVWDGGPIPSAYEYETKLHAITRGSVLSIGTENPSQAMATFHGVESCPLEVLNGWRTLTMQRATYLGRNQVGGNPITAQYFDGALMGTFQNLMFAYRDDCIPEIDGVDQVGATTLIPTSGGLHALVGAGVSDARMAKYVKLASSTLPIAEPQDIPVVARELRDWADVGGRLAMLVASTPPAIAYTDGTTIPLPADAPSSFSATALVDLGGRPALVGIGYTAEVGAGLWVLEHTGTSWTQTQVPGITNPAYVNAASRGSDLYIVCSISGDNGGKPRILFLTRRIGGTWLEPLAIGAGAEPQVLVDDAGVVHVTSNYEYSQIETGGHYARIDGTTVTTWVVSTGSFGHDPFAGIAPPRHSLEADGTIAIGWASDVTIKRPGERDERTVPLTIHIEGTGRVTSADGVVSCTQTCTVPIEVGRAVLLRADPRPADSPFSYDDITRPYVFRSATTTAIESVSFRF